MSSTPKKEWKAIHTMYIPSCTLCYHVLQKLQTLWHHKAWLTNAQVEEGKSAATCLGYRSIYLFSSIPMEHRKSRFKVELRNCFKGWSVRRPLLKRRGLKHVVNMHALDLGLTIFDAKRRRVLPKTKRARM